jgi:hypothetical protein
MLRSFGRLIPLFSRTIPFLTKRIILAAGLYFQFFYLNPFLTVQMGSFPNSLKEIVKEISDNTIFIECEGEIIGKAYCFH